MRHFIKLFREIASKYPDSSALSNYNGKSYCYRDVCNKVKELNEEFKKLGIKRGDHIAICGRNSAEWAISFLSTISYHAVAVPLLYDFTCKDIENLTIHSDSVIIFTEPKIAEEIDSQKNRKLRAIINIENFKILKEFKDESSSDISLENIQDINISYDTHNDLDEFSNEDELVAINYTSGTTGNPKGVMLTAGNISSNINFGLNRIPVRHGDRIVSMLPLAHMYSLAFEFLYPMCGGAEVVFLGKTPSPKILLNALQEVKPYILITVPLVLEKIFKANIIPKLNRPDIRILTYIPLIRRKIYNSIRKKLLSALGGNIRTIVAGGAAISKQVEEVMRRIRLPYTVGYGMTECAPLLGYEDWREFRSGSCGKAVTDMDIRIDSYDSINIPGEIQAKGKNVTIGYYKNEEATKALFTNDGWLHTGDLGVIDYSGNIIIKGRSKCMILTSNGQNIYPEEIEDKLNNLRWVSESIVVQRNRQILVALIALKEQYKIYNNIDVIKEQIKADINKILPNYSQISKVEILEEFQHTPKHSIKRFMYS